MGISEKNNQEFKNNFVISEMTNLFDLDEKKIEVEREVLGDKELINKILKNNCSNLENNSKNLELAKCLVGDVEPTYFQSLGKELKNQKDFALVGVKALSLNYFELNEKLKKDIDIVHEVIKSFIRENKDFVFVLEFIKSNFSGNKNELLGFYGVWLDKTLISMTHNFDKELKNMHDTDEQFCEIIISKKIYIELGEKTVLNTNLIKSFEKYLINIELFYSDTPENKYKIKKEFLLGYLGIEKSSLGYNSQKYFDSIIKLLSITDDKKNLFIEQQDTKEDSDENDVVNKELEENNTREDKDDIFDDKFDICLPNCSFDYLSGGGYIIHTLGNLSVRISETEKDNFSVLALQNYVKFYKVLYRLGLNFLIDKYKEDFIKLTGINYLYGNGTTKEVMLEVLELLWKNLGIKEEKNKKFSTFSEAYFAFLKLKSTTTINDIDLDPGINISAVEKKLMLDNKLNYAKATINIEAWE